ncbi:hypothetical protein ZIOFF_072405 [Zingiber officinale]|uniref:Uncharacterized protein n=1 Tax=Zingiber officinale TaxID=94328 RepID=A0A8J5BVF4_ZINOF|nr:hypothetical protein ZIOFF_072405 [Zingiber officinale]
MRAPPAAVLLSASLTNTKLSGLSGGPILFYIFPLHLCPRCSWRHRIIPQYLQFGWLASPPSLSPAATPSSSICHRRRAEYTGESIAAVTPFVLGFVPMLCIMDAISHVSIALIAKHARHRLWRPLSGWPPLFPSDVNFSPHDAPTPAIAAMPPFSCFTPTPTSTASSIDRRLSYLPTLPLMPSSLT